MILIVYNENGICLQDVGSGDDDGDGDEGGDDDGDGDTEETCGEGKQGLPLHSPHNLQPVRSQSAIVFDHDESVAQDCYSSSLTKIMMTIIDNDNGVHD